MYLEIDQTRYNCGERVLSPAGTLKFRGVSPPPPEGISAIRSFEDDGTLICEDYVSEYARTKYAGTVLALLPYLEPDPAPGPAGPTVEQRVDELEEALDMILEGVTGDEV